MPNLPALLRLDGNASSLLIATQSSIPQLAWFGEKLASGITANMLGNLSNAAHSFAAIDERAITGLFPQLSSGYMGSPGLIGHRQNQHAAHKFEATAAQINENELTLTLTDDNAELELTITIALHANSDVASISTRLLNLGNTDYSVNWLASATLPLPSHYSHCISQHGRWGQENQSYKRRIGPGRIDISNQHGRTGHEHNPSLICCEQNLNEDSGDALFVHMAWSGNYSFKIERLHDGDAYCQVGMLLNPGEEVLAPGETLHCPTVHFARAQGLNACSQRFHQFAREAILPAWTRKPRPVHANSWEAMYFDLQDENLCSLVDAAASIGAERFVLDDGWFINRRDDTAGLGDWTVDTKVFPNGLNPLVTHIRQHNMQFGLWFEPEMVNPNSNLYRNHPEWALHFNHIDTPLARNQLVLDVARDDVSNYLFEHITALVKEYEIDYIKWDMNRDLVLAGDGTHYKASKQPPAVYALMARIMEACPALEIESCASGGARCDLAVLKQTGRIWASDNIDPIARASIQQGFLRFFPNEIMGAHVGHEHAHLTGRGTNLHTRSVLALQGQFGFELDARKLDKADIATLNHYTTLYKTHRNWLSEATYWQLPTNHENLIAKGQVRANKQEALYSIVLIDSLNHTRPGMQRLRGLDATKHYAVSLVSTNSDDIKVFNRTLPDWCTEPVTTTGELLHSIGIPLPVLPPQAAILIHCREITT
jgi:alpha-galactosidase